MILVVLRIYKFSGHGQISGSKNYEEHYSQVIRCFNNRVKFSRRHKRASWFAALSAIIWLISLFMTIPIFYFSAVEEEKCQTTWLFESRVRAVIKLQNLQIPTDSKDEKRDLYLFTNNEISRKNASRSFKIRRKIMPFWKNYNETRRVTVVSRDINQDSFVFPILKIKQ